MSVGLGNHLLFGALRGLRVVERPRSGGPLRRLEAPTPTAEAAPARRPSSIAPTEKLTLSARAKELSQRLAATSAEPSASPDGPALDANTRRALQAYAEASVAGRNGVGRP